MLIQQAQASLEALAGPAARFHAHQLEAIEAVVERRRVLVVQRTGWGKSAVYFIAARLMRDRGDGPFLIVSPLLVLMRNQVEAAHRVGLEAVTINSSLSPEERSDAMERAPGADLVFVTPETLQSPAFARDVLGELERGPSTIVIDEVHCISEWGHDFRPKYRRIRDFLDRLPSGIGVLGTTATANERTVQDICQQLGEDLHVIRGPLVRDSLRLHVDRPRDQGYRLAWLARFVSHQVGAGIVYCLTTHDCERIARWLRTRGIDAVEYHGSRDDEARRDVEARLVANDVDAVVATTALGMGYDKPDLRWVVHYQTPAGPVAYYQQVGRAGRGVAEAVGVMLRGHEDDDIHDWFISTAYPDRGTVGKLLEVLEHSDDGMSKYQLLARLNVRAGRLDTALVILEDEGVVSRAGSRYFRTVRPYEYPEERVAAVAAAKLEEYRSLVAYAEGSSCLMEQLQTLLDDPSAAPCGRCGPCAGDSPLATPIDPAEVAAARQFLWRAAGEYQPRKLWPPATADVPSGRIPSDSMVEAGRVLGRHQDDGYGTEALESRSAGQPSERLLHGVRDLIDEWGPQPPPTWLTYIPSRSNSAFARALAEAVAGMLGIDLVEVVTKRDDGPRQQRMQNSQQAATNAWRTVAVDAGAVRHGPVLLLDDVVNTRWTVTVAGFKLREAGAGPVFPLVLCELARST